jgi:hypothetical protein
VSTLVTFHPNGKLSLGQARHRWDAFAIDRYVLLRRDRELYQYVLSVIGAELVRHPD